MTAVRNIGIPGFISGGLKFNTTATPPTVMAGLYDVGGEMVKLSADLTLASSDALAQSRAAFMSFTQCLVVMDRTGSCKWLPYGEGAVASASGSITSISGAGTTKTLVIASGTLTSNSIQNKILVVYGNNGVNGAFKVTSNTTTDIVFEALTTVTGGASGTWVAYERVKTLHGTGTSAAITTDADVLKYTPSYGENGWDAGIAAFDPIKNGYYLTIPGYTSWRVIGNFRLNTSSQPNTDIISHKSGRDKDDNHWFVSGNGGLGSVNTRSQYYSTVGYIFGCDYVLRPGDTSTGGECVIKRAGLLFGSGVGGNTGTGGTIAVTYNATGTSQPSILTTSEIIGTIGHQENNKYLSGVGSRRVYPNDLIRVQSDVVADYASTLASFSGSLTL